MFLCFCHSCNLCSACRLYVNTCGCMCFFAFVCFCHSSNLVFILVLHSCVHNAALIHLCCAMVFVFAVYWVNVILGFCLRSFHVVLFLYLVCAFVVMSSVYLSPFDELFILMQSCLGAKRVWLFLFECFFSFTVWFVRVLERADRHNLFFGSFSPWWHRC